ncbi:hypothetical protein EYC80_002484 [Monilinia laxa]|uniref:Uncharacterized protein n=1 Tax=Monilinia laxa TaxID=61186 RepID=A0A5N6K3Z2_MONLA|nr:hypothetical protein EYC80_002484 [Monilinia laxa]
MNGKGRSFFFLSCLYSMGLEIGGLARLLAGVERCMHFRTVFFHTLFRGRLIRFCFRVMIRVQINVGWKV